MAYTSDLRVLMITASFYPYMGGLETHVYEVSRQMRDWGVDVAILTTDRSASLPVIDEIAGVPVYRVPAYPSQKDYYFAPGLLKAIEQGRWDIIHCQGGVTMVPPMAMLAAQRAQLPYVASFHSNAPQSAFRKNIIRPIQYRILRHFMSKAERLIAVSKYESGFFQESLRLPAEKFVVIPNGSGLPQLENVPTPDANAPLIVSAGRLHPLKGHDRIIRAMPQILAKVPTAKLRVAGHGEEEVNLRQLVTELNLDDVVTIQGVPTDRREEMTALLSSASLIVLLSQFEAHPLAVLEALSLGKPMVVTYTSGLMEFVDEGYVTGVALDSNVDTVANRVIEQLLNPVYPPPIQLPTWCDCADNLLKLYSEVVRHRNYLELTQLVSFR